MDSNAKLGDCVVTEAAHQIEAWTYNSNPQRPVNVSEGEVVDLYRSLSPGNDGVAILDFLKPWRRGVPLGRAKDTLSAFVALNPAVQAEVEQGIYLFGGAFVGLELTNAVVHAADELTAPWVLPPPGPIGPEWAPNGTNGHCVIVLGYTRSSVSLVTWGQVKEASWEFFRAYCDEAFALLSRGDWLDPRGIPPSGFDFARLQGYVALVAKMPPASAPAPSPPVGAGRHR